MASDTVAAMAVRIECMTEGTFFGLFPVSSQTILHTRPVTAPIIGRVVAQHSTQSESC